MPPAWSAIPAVVTVHDLIHLRHYSRLHRTYYDHILRPLYRRCRAILCVSEYTRREFLCWSGMQESRVITLYNGVSERFMSGSSHERLFPFLYVLYAGNRRRYKNLQRLLQAYATSALPARGIRFVLTGAADDMLLRWVRQLRIADAVHFAGYVDDAAMPALYRHAHIVALVSLEEGFGLPIVEAMAVGAPVLTSNVSATAEIAGNAAMLVDPYSVDSIREGLQALAFEHGERESRIRLGHARARSFSWDKTAREWWRVLSEAHQMPAAR